MSEGSEGNSYKERAQQAYAYYRQYGLIGIIRNGWIWLLADSDRLTALSTFAIFLATAVAVGVGIAQWTVLRGQLNEMRASSEQIERSIKASNRIADESKTANALTGAANRAWIGAAMVTVVPPIFEGKASTITINFANSGKSPAYVIRAKCAGGILPASPTDPQYTLTAIQTEYGSKSIVVPGQVMGCPFYKAPVPPQELARVKLSAGAYTFYIYGEILYRDVGTQSQHATHVCWLYNASVDAYVFCPTYNSAD